MLMTVLSAAGLAAISVTIHAAGFSALFRAELRRKAAQHPSGFWRTTVSLIAVTSWLILIHSLEICVWALFYFWQGYLPDAESAFYFSGVTYTSTGYGDIVLSEEHRMLAPFEALTGILMIGLSTGLFVALISRWIGSRFRLSPQ